MKENEWCKLAYWELSQRVGRLYPVQNTAVNIFWTDLMADGLSLETLTHHSFSPPESVYKNRNKIGLGR
jgi:MAD (mothers against decapentaplegic) family protein 6/7